MKKYILYLLLLVSGLAKSQTAPVSPSGPVTTQFFLDLSDSSHWTKDSRTGYYKLNSVVGGGTLTNISGVNTNGFTWSIANPTTTPALTLILQNATTTLDGQLSHVDWNIFNGKQNSLGFTPENVANKATSFGVLNNTLYPTTQATSTYVTGLGYLVSPLVSNGDLITQISGVPGRVAIGGANTLLHGGTIPSYSNIVNGDIANSTIDLMAKVTGLLPIANGGTGTASPGIIAGTNITLSGTWPNQTVNSTGGSGTSFYTIGQYATTAALLSNTYNNGTAGVGATLIGNANGAIVLDGATPTTGQLVLVWNEANPAHDGIFDVTDPGDASHPYILTRDANSNTPGSLVAGSQFYTQLGTNYTGITFTQTTTGTVVIGTTNLVYAGNGSTFLTNTLLGTGTSIDPFTINPLGPGFSTTPTAFNVMVRDGNANSFSNNHILGYQQIATSASTTTFLVSSPHTTSFTGTTTQTGLLPVVSGLTAGYSVKIEDNSTGVVTIQSSGANTVQALAAGTSAVFTFNGTAGTGSASWDVNYSVSGVSSISVASANGFTGSSSGGSTPALTLSLQNATTSQSGQLTSTDWNTFNNKQAAGSYLTAIGVTTANGISGTSSGGTTPNLTLTLANITPTTLSTTIKPATIYQTPLGTAGTDSVMVKHSGGTVSAIPANYYSTGGGGISGLTTNYISKASSSTTIANSLLYDDGTGVMLGTTSNAGYGFDNAGTGRVQGNFAQGIIPISATPTATPGTGGTLSAGTYYYKVCPIDALGNVGLPSGEVSGVISGGNNKMALAWSNTGAQANASLYRIFRGTSSNGENVYYTTTLGADQTTFNDTGAASTGGSPPTVNSTATVFVKNDASSYPSILLQGYAPSFNSSPSRYNGKYTTSLGSLVNAPGQLILGDDGTNYIQFGTTDAGGSGQFWTNCSNAFGTAPNGTHVMDMSAAGLTTFYKQMTITNATGSNILNISGSGTNSISESFGNTGANASLGVASSTGTGFTATLSNYATALFTQNATDIFFGTNQIARMVIFSGGPIAVNTTTNNGTDQLQVNGTISSGIVATSTGGLKLSGLTAGTISVLPQANGTTYNYNLPTSAGTSGQVQASAGGGSSPMTWVSVVTGHTIFTPATGGTVSLVNNQTNVINPSGTLATLTVNLPSSPANDDRVFIKYTQAITAVTYGNGTVVDGITAPTAGGLVVLIYDSGTTSWY